MNSQRILFAGAALAMAASVFLPIAQEAIADGRVTMQGTDTALTKTSAALALILFVACFMGRRHEKVGLTIRLFAFALGLYGACVGAFFFSWFTFELAPGTRQLMDAELLWPGLGVFVLLVSSAVLIVVTFLSPFMFSTTASSSTESTPPAGEPT